MPGEAEQPGAAAAAAGRLFTWAAGDFLLAPRSVIQTVRGYSECGRAFAVDSLIVLVVAAHGFGSLVLGDGCEVLHQAHRSFQSLKTGHLHAARYNATHVLQLSSLANIRPERVVLATNHSRLEEALDVTRWNGEDWGLATHAIQETRLWTSCSAAEHSDEPLLCGQEGEGSGDGTASCSTLDP